MSCVCRASDACHRSQKSPVLRQRIDSVNECLTYDVFRQSLNSFYEVDRVVFTLLFALNVDLHASNITRQEFVTFVQCTSTRTELNLLSVCILLLTGVAKRFLNVGLYVGLCLYVTVTLSCNSVGLGRRWWNDEAAHTGHTTLIIMMMTVIYPCTQKCSRMPGGNPPVSEIRHCEDKVPCNQISTPQHSVIHLLTNSSKLTEKAVM